MILADVLPSTKVPRWHFLNLEYIEPLTGKHKIFRFWYEYLVIYLYKSIVIATFMNILYGLQALSFTGLTTGWPRFLKIAVSATEKEIKQELTKIGIV